MIGIRSSITGILGHIAPDMVPNTRLRKSPSRYIPYCSPKYTNPRTQPHHGIFFICSNNLIILPRQSSSNIAGKQSAASIPEAACCQPLLTIKRVASFHNSALFCSIIALGGFLLHSLSGEENRKYNTDNNADAEGDRVHESGAWRHAVSGIFPAPNQVAVAICYDSAHRI